MPPIRTCFAARVLVSASRTRPCFNHAWKLSDDVSTTTAGSKPSAFIRLSTSTLRVVNEAQRMTACRPDVDMSALGVFVTKPFDGCLDIENALPFLQESSRRPSRLIPMSKRSQPIARSWTRTSRSTITTDFSARCLRSTSIMPEPVEQQFSTTHQN